MAKLPKSRCLMCECYECPNKGKCDIFHCATCDGYYIKDCTVKRGESADPMLEELRKLGLPIYRIQTDNREEELQFGETLEGNRG